MVYRVPLGMNIIAQLYNTTKMTCFRSSRTLSLKESMNNVDLLILGKEGIKLLVKGHVTDKICIMCVKKNIKEFTEDIA